MKKENNINRKMDNMLSESIKLSNKPKQQLNEGLFEIITQGGIALSLVLWAFQLKGYDPNKAGLLKLIGDLKLMWKQRNMDKELLAVLTKMATDPEIIQAAKDKVQGPRGGPRREETRAQYAAFLKKKLTPEELKTINKFSRWGKGPNYSTSWNAHSEQPKIKGKIGL